MEKSASNGKIANWMDQLEILDKSDLTPEIQAFKDEVFELIY